MKKLYKSNTQKIIAGVLGGIAEYFEIDPTLIRLGYVAVAIFAPILFVALYVIGYFVIPNKIY